MKVLTKSRLHYAGRRRKPTGDLRKSSRSAVRLFGPFGGMFVSELLVPALQEVSEAFVRFRRDAVQQRRLKKLLRDFAGRPTPLFLAGNISRQLGFKLYLKREDLLHGGAHKTNNTVGQGLLAQYMNKKELIAETGAGQHGVAVAMVGALLHLPVKIFMGECDVERQRPNVERMRLLGAEVISVTSGSKTLKDAINDAMRYYVAHSRDSYYIFGSVVGPHPFPSLVRHFQKVIGREARQQILKETGKLPTHVVACVGGGSNALGIFSAFLKDTKVKLLGVEAAGGATLSNGRPGILHGSYSYCLQDKDGQIEESQSISAGLDYPGVGPEHSFLKEQKRVTYVTATDDEALAAFKLLTEKEGIIPALESAHAIAYALTLKGKIPTTSVVIANLSGRGDKDLATVLSH